ncbi:MAG: hypothetical protein AAFW84_09720 [Cyanobacteria bacterium J06635_15]
MQFATGMIPDDVDTFEKLAAWTGSVLHFHGFSLDYNERQPSTTFGDSGIQAVFEKQGPSRSFQKDNRLIYRLSLLIAPDYDSTAFDATYQAVQEIVTAPADTSFLNPNYTP